MEENIENNISPKNEEKEGDKEKKEEQIKDENQIFEKELKTLPEDKLIQFTKNSYNIRLKLYNKQIKDLEESYKEITEDIPSLVKDGHSHYYYVGDYLIFFNCRNIIFNFWKKPSNDVQVLINNIIKSFNIDNFENIPEKPKKYHKELMKYYEARLNDALKKYRENKDTKSLSDLTFGSNGRDCCTDKSREKILLELLKYKIEIRYINNYENDIKFNDKISNIKSQINQLTKNNTLNLEERIDLIEKIDGNINALLELMTNLKKAFFDCFYKWYGYSYYNKDKIHNEDNLFGLKNEIMNFMYSDKMKEVLTFDTALFYEYISFY